MSSTAAVFTTDETIQALSTLADPVLSFETLSAYPTEKQRRFLSLAQQCPPVESEVKAFVQSLSLRFNLAVVTSSSRTEVTPILAAAGMLDYFTGTVCAEDVARHKPDPEPYRVAAGMLRAERVLGVEDSPAGIESGRAAGFDVAIVPSPTEMPGVVKKHVP
ncbi:MAG: HAD family phosphatase [Acidobacteriaceae bacterium]|nr:HAD family phosphatase [Acidobacteriaceae bacterium]